MTTMNDNLNGLELLSGRLVTLFLTLAIAEEEIKRFPAGTHLKVTNDPNPDLNGEYTWDGKKLSKTTNNTLEKAKEEAKKEVDKAVTENLTTEAILDKLNGAITGSELDRRLAQRIEQVPSIRGNVEELKNEVNIIQNEVNVFINNMTYDIANIREDIDKLQLEVDLDFQAIKDLIDQKFVEVDDLRKDLNKEIADRIQAVKDETDARVAEIRLLNDGLTQEITDRKDGDKAVLAYVDNYKASNETALANIRDEVKVAVDTSVASAQKVDAMDARVTSAENNANTALENSATAVTKVNTLATDVGAISERVDTLSADVVKAVDDSGKALTNSATAIESAKTAVDKANAVAEQVTVVQAKLNDKSTTYREATAPTVDTHPDLTKGDIWINPDKNNEQRRWDGTNWVDISDVRVGDNATAISKLTATVTQQGEDIQAQSTKITDLETSIGDKADGSALESLKVTVTDQGGKIQTNTESITALQGSVAGKADAKALSDLQVTVTQQGEDITSQGIAITSVENSLAGKADSSALDSLKSTVTEQGNSITAQGQAITGLSQEVSGKASNQTVSELKSTVDKQGDDITAQGKVIDSIKTSVDGKADAEALNSLTTKVSEVDAKVTTQGQAITSLENNLAGKADAKALTTLETKVTAVDNKVTTQGQAITALQNSVAGKADASAVNQLKTTVEQQGNTITSQGQAITKVDAKVNDLSQGITNLFSDSARERTSAPREYLNVNTNEELNSIYARGLITISFDISVAVAGNVQVYCTNYNPDYTFQTSVNVPEANKYFRRSVTVTPTRTANNTGKSSLEFYGIYDTGRIIKVKNIKIEAGGTATAWSPSPNDLASAQAVTALDSKVTTIGNKVDVNSSAITDIRASVAGKADASALNSLKTTVEQQGNTITSQGTAITSVNAKLTDVQNAGGDNYIKNGGAEYETKYWVLNASVAGQNLLTFTRPDSSIKYLYYLSPASEVLYGGITQVVPITSGIRRNRNYTLSFRAVKPTTAEVVLGLIVHRLHTDGTQDQLVTSFGSLTTNLDSPPKFTYQLNTNTAKNLAGLKFIFILAGGTSTTATAGFMLTDIQLEEGNVATGYKTSLLPAMEDGVANSTAITKLDARTTVNEGAINTQATQITGLQSSIAGKADTSALNSLKTTVEQQGNAITAQGTAITQVESSVNSALQAVTIADTRDTNQSPAWYWTYHPRRVVNEFKSASVIGVTGLGNWVDMETRVYYTDSSGGNIVQYAFSPNNSVLQMERNSIGSGASATWSAWRQPLKAIDDSAKASAIAVSKLTTDVSTIDGKVNANSQAITQVGTTVGNSSINILVNSNTLGNKPVGQNPYPFWSRAMSKKLVRGKQYTLVFEAEFVTGGANSTFAPYVHGNQTLWTTNQSFGRQVRVVKFTQNTFNTGTDGAINFYIVGSQPDQNNSSAKVYWACLYEDDLNVPPQTWQPNSFENTALVQQSLQSINGIKAEYTLKTDVNGYVAGIGFINEGAGKSKFIIRADEFAIANPASVNNESKYAFVYRSSATTLPNGTVIPAGLYIDNLMLGDVDARKINATSIRAISANLGTFESSNASGTTIISGSLIEVKDNTGRTRVKIGVW